MKVYIKAGFDGMPKTGNFLSGFPGDGDRDSSFPGENRIVD